MYASMCTARPRVRRRWRWRRAGVVRGVGAAEARGSPRAGTLGRTGSAEGDVGELGLVNGEGN